MKNTRNTAIAAISAIVLSFTGIAYASDDDHKDKYPKWKSSESPKPSPSPSESETPKPKPTKSPTPSPSPSESESPKPEPTKTPTPSPTPTVTPTPTPTPTPTVTPTPTPTTIFIPVLPKPIEIGGSDPKPAEPPVKEVVEKYTKTVQCGKPVTFSLTGPNDATYTVLQKPKKGSLAINLKNNTVTWNPNKNHCQIGGNDSFVIQWIDSKGNKGTITKAVVTLLQGDIPNMIRTGK